ncbi:MAG: hypothetical protein QXL94_00465 [Candidatus Parvarchaeum sp.]
MAVIDVNVNTPIYLSLTGQSSVSDSVPIPAGDTISWSATAADAATQFTLSEGATADTAQLVIESEPSGIVTVTATVSTPSGDFTAVSEYQVPVPAPTALSSISINSVMGTPASTDATTVSSTDATASAISSTETSTSSTSTDTTATATTSTDTTVA